MNCFFRTIALPALALSAALCALLAPSAAADYETFIRQYGEQPVEAQLRVAGGGSQQWKLSRLNDNMIEVDLGGGDVMSFNVEDPTLPGRLVLPPVANATFANLIANRNYDGALQLLRPAVYPLLRFRSLPANYAQFYDPINLLVGTLIDSGNLVEAAEILSNNKELLVQERFQRRVFGLIEGLVAQNEYDEATSLLALIPMEEVPSGLKSVLLDFAYRLRIEGKYAELIPVYESIIPMLEGTQKAEAQIWLAYCLINTGKREAGEAIIAALPVPKPGEDIFGLYQLLSGYNLYSEKEYAKALDIFSRGLVYAHSVDPWIPEISYYIGNCYRALGKVPAARSAYEEIARLWPTNPWAERAKLANEEMLKEEAEKAAAAAAVKTTMAAPAPAPAQGNAG